MLIGASIRREGQGASRQLLLLVAARRLTLPVERDSNRSKSRQLRALDRHQFDREAVLVPFTGLQRADADHLTRDLLALLVGDRNDHAILALLVAPGVMYGPLDAHRRNRLSLRLGIDGVEAQVMVAARANVRALQNRFLAVRTYPGPAEGTLASDCHR